MQVLVKHQMQQLQWSLGCDGVLINTAIAKSKNPIEMAKAMKFAVIAGRKSYLSGRMKKNFFGSCITKKKGII